MSPTAAFLGPLPLAPRSPVLRTKPISRPAPAVRHRRARSVVVHERRCTVRAAVPGVPVEVDDATFEDEVLKTSETVRNCALLLPAARANRRRNAFAQHI